MSMVLIYVDSVVGKRARGVLGAHRHVAQLRHTSIERNHVGFNSTLVAFQTSLLVRGRSFRVRRRFSFDFRVVEYFRSGRLCERRRYDTSNKYVGRFVRGGGFSFEFRVVESLVERAFV